MSTFSNSHEIVTKIKGTDLISIESVKSFLSISKKSHYFDDVLSIYINSAISELEHISGISILHATIKLSNFKPSVYEYINLPFYPLRNIITIEAFDIKHNSIPFEYEATEESSVLYIYSKCNKKIHYVNLIYEVGYKNFHDLNPEIAFSLFRHVEILFNNKDDPNFDNQELFKIKVNYRKLRHIEI
jgi:hypothetical protein